MATTITKTEYQVLRTEIKGLKEKLVQLERIFKEAQRKIKEEEILTIAKEAEKLLKDGRLPELKSLRDLR